QREVVPVIQAADRPDPGHAVPVAELAAECVAGVRGVGDHAARPHDVGDLSKRAPLRVGRMNVEVPGHAMSLGPSPVRSAHRTREGRPWTRDTWLWLSSPAVPRPN